MATMDDDEIVEAIKDALREKASYVIDWPTEDEGEIDCIRKQGRRAARELGWKVRTFQREFDDGSGFTQVIVVVTESSPMHEQLMQARIEKAKRRAMDSLELPGGLYGSTQRD